MKKLLIILILLCHPAFADLAAVCNSTNGIDGSDATAELQAALDSDTEVVLPASGCRITSPVYAWQSKVVRGSGRKSIIWANFSGPQNGVVIVAPHDTLLGTGGELTNFSIISNTASLYLDVTLYPASYIYRWKFDHLFMNNTSGGRTIVLNNPTSSDGFFTSEISNNFSYGGYYLPRLGDSITIDNNTITGSGNGIEFDSVQGAANVVIRENNITSKGIAILAGEYVQNTKILDNNIENYDGAPPQMIVVYGSSLKRAVNPIIKGNMLNGHNQVQSAGSLIAIGYTDDGIIDENRTLQGATTCIAIFNTAKKIRIGKRNISTCSTPLWNQSPTTTIIE